jgi:hypothetical protein
MHLATKPQPRYCGITSVSSTEHGCWGFQPTKKQHLIEIKNKGMTNLNNQNLDIPNKQRKQKIWRSAAVAAAFEFN